MALITITTGKELQRSSSCTVTAFVNTVEGERPLFVACARRLVPVQEVGTPVTIQARPGVAAAAGGSWVTATYEFSDVTLIKLVVGKSNESTAGLRRAMAYLRIRDGAPLTRIVVPVRLNANSSLQEVVIEGTFEVVPIDQLAVQHGIEVPLNFRRFYHSLSQQACFRTLELAPASSRYAAATIKTEEVQVGTETVKVVVQGRNRKLKL
ncbi:hypothetical protein H10PHJ05_66 [Aeromonas phage HJ05]|nr:hypothetical protein H10PHJ05_66 [Aeromonas phage HJ05]